MFYILLGYAFFASAISTNKIILYSLSPTLLTAIRMLCGGLVLWAVGHLQKHHKLTWHHVKAYGIPLLIIAICTTLIPSNLKAFGMKHMDSSKAAFFGALDPFFTALVSYAILGERLSWRKLLGILIGFTGAMILLLSTSNLELPAIGFLSWPELALISAVIITRCGWMGAQHLLKKNVLTTVQLNTFTMLVSGVLSGLVAWLSSELAVRSLATAPFSILQQPPFSWWSPDATLLFFIAFTVFIGNVIAYNFYAGLLQRYSATFVALTSFSIPIFVHFYGWFFLSEKLSSTFFLACLVTFAGLAIFFRDEIKKL